VETSVVMCTRNRLSDILRFTKSLYLQSELPSEYVIVDSSDKPLEEESEYNALIASAPFNVVYRHTAPGLTRQRNVGIKLATGAIFHFFDDDIVLYPDYLEIMNATHCDHPEYMGGMGTIVLSPVTFKDKLRIVFAKVFLLLRSHGDGKFYRSGFPKFPHGNINKLSDTEILSGGVMSIKREIFDEFTFDNKLEGYSFLEDVDFSRRVSYKYKLFFNPDAKLEHHHTVVDSRERRKQFLYNHRYFFFKNFYPLNRLNLIPHWWSILGLFALSILKPKSRIAGYLDALKEFSHNKKELI
jgi:GT2 family glycosyltransferase